MGIKGLLPFLRKASIPVKLQDFNGFVAAIDTYCWIHKSSYACAMDLALGNPTDQYVRYALKFLNLIMSCNIKPILVFDGANLPSKADTEAKRRLNKEAYRKKAAEYLLKGDRSAAMECFERSVTVTPEMAHNVIKAARNLGVDCIVAPYEADAQLAYLNRSGYADFVITEDSDLLLFGCKQVLFKLDMTGSGVLVTLTEGIGELCCGMRANEFTESKFRFMGIMSGCDYFAGIPGIGMSTAAKILRQTRLIDFKELLSKLGMYVKLNSNAISGLVNEDGTKQSKTVKERNYGTKSTDPMSGSNKLHHSFIDLAVQAERTFRLQVVFDPGLRAQRRLTDPSHDDIVDEKNRIKLASGDTQEQDQELFSYAGHVETDVHKAFQLALGNIDCLSGKVVDNFDPDQKDKSLHRSHTSPSFSRPSFSRNMNIKFTQADKDRKMIRLKTSIWDKNYPVQNVLLYSVNENVEPDKSLCQDLVPNLAGDTNYQSTVGKQLHISASIQHSLQNFIRRPSLADSKHQEQPDEQQQQQQRSPIFNPSKQYLEANSEEDLLLGYKQETIMKTPKSAANSILSGPIRSASPYFRSSQLDLISSSSSESKEVADALFDAICDPVQAKSDGHILQQVDLIDQNQTTALVSDPESDLMENVSESTSPTLNGVTAASVAFESKLSRFQNQTTPIRNNTIRTSRIGQRNIFKCKPFQDVTNPVVVSTAQTTTTSFTMSPIHDPVCSTKTTNSVRTDECQTLDPLSPKQSRSNVPNDDCESDLSPSFLRAHVSQSRFTFKRKSTEPLSANKPKMVKQSKQSGPSKMTGTTTLHTYFEKWRFEAHAP